MIDMKYAYLDTNNVLRITIYKSVAMQQAKNKHCIETDFPCLYGYPVDENNKIIVLYSATKERKNKFIPSELSELYRLLENKE
jgi:hypothetical protein